MKVLFFCLSTLFFLSSCTSNPAKDEESSAEPSMTFSRYFSLTTCKKGKVKCIGPVVKNLEDANVTVKLEKFNKGYESGVSAFDSTKIVENGVPFISEIRITKKKSSDTYYIYLMLRSGPTLSRQGVVKTFEVKDMSSLKAITIVDKPIEFGDGELKAELTIGPPLKLSN